MKKKDLAVLRKKELSELIVLVNEKKAELVKTQIQTVAAKEKNLKKAKNISHEIAQIQTIVREKTFLAEDKLESAKAKIKEVE